MKRIIFLFVAIFIAACREDAEVPALKFDINASTDKTLTERGLNDNAIIKFDFKTEYDYTAAPLSYKIDYDKQGILKLGDEELKKDTTYKLEKPELTLSYVGKEAGKHTIKVHFFNDKGINILKEIEIPYVKYNFTVAVLGDEAPYQGELKEYKLTITPENATVKDSYKIKFISYDENDPTLQKSYIALNGTKIEFNKVYDIEASKEQKISLKSFHSGAKNLIYTIINSSSEKQEKISQNVKASQIEVKNLSFNKLITNTLGDNLQLRGFINKTPALSKVIQYRTWIVEVPNEQKDGIENTDNTYKDFTLPGNNEFVLNVNVKKYGTYKYMLQFRDEFGTETEPISFEIKVIDKNFEVEQKVATNLENVIQGQDVEVSIEVKEADAASTEEYQIQFLRFDSADELLKKSKIIFNNERIRLNEWYTVKKNGINRVVFNSFNPGDKKILYKIKNTLYSKEKELPINIKKTAISLKNLALKANKIYIDEQFKIEGVVEKTYSENKNIEYRTWLSAGNDNKFKDLSNTYRSYELFKDNVFSLTFRATEVGRYILKVQVKDEYGNESEIKEFPINVIGNEFNVEQKIKTNVNNVTQGQNVELDFEVKENHNTNETYQIQFLSLDPSDIYLQKTKIKFNGSNDIQLNKWYSINKGAINKIVVSTFYSGAKKLVYQIKNSMYTQNKELDFNVKKTVISLKNLVLKANKIYINEPFKIEGIVEKTYSENKSIHYKTWLSSGNASNFKDVTNVYTNLNFPQEENTLSLQFNPVAIGDYVLNIQAKDEYGNESEIKTFNIKADSKLEFEKIEAKYKIKVDDFESSFDGSPEWSMFKYNISSTLKIKAKAGNGNLLYKIKVEVEDFKNLIHGFVKEELLNLKNEIDTEIVLFSADSGDVPLRNDKSIRCGSGIYTDRGIYRMDLDYRVIDKWKKSNPKAKIILYDNVGNEKKIEIPLTIIAKLNDEAWRKYVNDRFSTAKYCIEHYFSWIEEEEEE